MLQFKLDTWKDTLKRDAFINHLDNVSQDVSNNVVFVIAGDSVLIQCEMQELSQVFYTSFADWVNSENAIVECPQDCDYVTELSQWDGEELICKGRINKIIVKTLAQ